MNECHLGTDNETITEYILFHLSVPVGELSVMSVAAAIGCTSQLRKFSTRITN
jgi:hypothetical protein